MELLNPQLVERAWQRLYLAGHDMGVDLGGLDIGVAQELLEDADIGAVLQHVEVEADTLPLVARWDRNCSICLAPMVWDASGRRSSGCSAKSTDNSLLGAVGVMVIAQAPHGSELEA